jgi:hypothetical protein
VIKTLTMLSLVCGLAVAGWMWTRQAVQTTDAAPEAVLAAAATALEFSHRANGTYAGEAPEGVTLVSGDQFRYCIEFSGYSLAGPGGTPQPGDCPRR